MNEEQMSWDEYLFGMAKAATKKCKDPSTKVGAAISRPHDNSIASTGWNGFPKGVRDLPERYENRALKYRLTCHAEANAIVRAREDLDGYTMHVTAPPCHECAKLIIQAGITEVVHRPTTADLRSRWKESFDAAALMFSEAGVTAREVPEPVEQPVLGVTKKGAVRRLADYLFRRHFDAPRYHTGGIVPARGGGLQPGEVPVILSREHPAFSRPAIQVKAVGDK